MSLFKMAFSIIIGMFIYFFNGCGGPPAPVTITTPKETTRELHINWENHLVISVVKKNYQLKYDKHIYLAPDSISLDKYFTDNNKDLINYKDSLAIRDYGMSIKQFSMIISILKKHNYYKYQLLIK